MDAFDTMATMDERVASDEAHTCAGSSSTANLQHDLEHILETSNMLGRDLADDGGRDGDGPPSPRSSAGSSALGAGESNHRRVVCIGCGQEKGVSAAFTPTLAHPRCSWRYLDGRGRWCQTCGHIYVLKYQSTHTLLMMDSFLEDHACPNELELEVVGYNMLRREGVERITKELLEHRVASLKFALGALRVPWRPFVVRRARDVFPDPTHMDKSDLDYLCTYRNGNDDEVGFLQVLENPQQQRAAHDVEDLGALPHPLMRRFISVTNDADKQWLARLRGDDVSTTETRVVLYEPSGAASGASAVSGPAQRLAARLGVAKRASLALLTTCSTAAWSDVRESAFTQPCNNV